MCAIRLLAASPGLTLTDLRILLEREATPFDPGRIVQKNAPFCFEERKNPIRIDNRYDWQALGTVSLVAPAATIRQMERYAFLVVLVFWLVTTVIPILITVGLERIVKQMGIA